MSENMEEKVVGYEADIKPLFNETDQDHMLFMFDLWSYDDVKDNADDIYDSVSHKRMPKPPLPPWTQDQMDLFKAWIDGGHQP
jgi:hypothetical protein